MDIKEKKGIKKSKEVWIGLITVKPKPGNKFFAKNSKGAYVNILAWADRTSEFQSEVKHALDDYHLKLVEMEDVEPLSVRQQKFNVDSKLINLSAEVENTGNVRFGTFHYFEHEK